MVQKCNKNTQTQKQYKTNNSMIEFRRNKQTAQQAHDVKMTSH